MTTKDRILETARKLLNEHGLKSVTARLICKEMAISLGSFSYHFPDKDEIITLLYERMCREMQEIMLVIPPDDSSILYYLEMQFELFKLQLKYKFYYLNLFQILHENEQLRRIHENQSNLGRALNRHLLQLYIERGVLRKEIRFLNFDQLVEAGQILNNSWLLYADLRSEEDERELLMHYLKLSCGFLEPHLTAKAREEYQLFFEELAVGI